MLLTNTFYRICHFVDSLTRKQKQNGNFTENSLPAFLEVMKKINGEVMDNPIGKTYIKNRLMNMLIDTEVQL